MSLIPLLLWSKLRYSSNILSFESTQGFLFFYSLTVDIGFLYNKRINSYSIIFIKIIVQVRLSWFI